MWAPGRASLLIISCMSTNARWYISQTQARRAGRMPGPFCRSPSPESAEEALHGFDIRNSLSASLWGMQQHSGRCHCAFECGEEVREYGEPCSRQ
ncbi:hypothetical protein V8C44DRAFT_322214 [Trichoderma aethiopicum]